MKGPVTNCELLHLFCTSVVASEAVSERSEINPRIIASGIRRMRIKTPIKIILTDKAFRCINPWRGYFSWLEKEICVSIIRRV